jgi:5-carboxymethyl-2-hydroxymuconate isomerase
MNDLNTKANIAGADDFYAELLSIHEGRSKEQSDAINARLILLLANHIGDRATLSDAMQKAVTAGQS